MTIARPVADRFWEKVNKEGPIHPYHPELGKCWLWTGRIQKNGYGQFNYDGKKRVYAHRVAFELQVAKITKGLNVLHSCDNKPCVRRSHLREGTQGENIRESVDKGRHFTPWRK